MRVRPGTNHAPTVEKAGWQSNTIPEVEGERDRQTLRAGSRETRYRLSPGAGTSRTRSVARGAAQATRIRRKASRLLPDRCRARFYKTHSVAICWHWDNKMYDCTGFPRSLTCRFTHRCQVAYEPILMKALHGMSRLVLAPRIVFGQIRNCFSYSRSSFGPRSAPGLRPSRARGSQIGARAYVREIYDRRRV